MWILKNSKELLDNLQSHTLTSIHSIKTYDFSTLYTTIPHTKLKARLSELIKNAFKCKNGEIYTSTIKSPSAVQISKSLKQTQSIDKVL